MAIMDALARFADNTAVGALTIATRADVGNIYDTQADTYAIYPSTSQTRDLGDYVPVYVNFIVGTAVTLAASTSIKFDVSHAAAAASGALTTPVELVSRTFSASVAAGTQWSLFLPVGVKVNKYMGVGATDTAALAAASSGSITAWIDMKPVETRILYVEGRNWV